MVFEKREKKIPFQRLKNLILGKERPNLITRVSVGIGFLIWVYMISWHILTIMSLFLIGSLKKSELIEGSFNRVGSKLYNYPNTINRLMVYSLVELVAYMVLLIGLILIYRKKRLGFLLYVIANVAVVFGTILILGLKYFQYEISYFDISLIAISTSYFGIGALWFYKWKPGQKTGNTFKQSIN